MTTPRWRLILNGKSAGNDDLRSAVGRWRGQGVQLEVRVTWEEGDAERYVAEAIDHGVDVIVAAGGDGTLSAVAETLAHREEPADTLPSLALVPMGTANDFATSVGIPTEPSEAFALIGQVSARPIDLLRVDADGKRWWCANLASGGFGTQVTVETDAGLKKMLGGLAYVITGIAKLGRIEPITARLTGPDFEWEGGFIALGIGNGRQAGGGQQLCPQALIDDGLLDVTVVPELDGEVAATLGQMLTGGKDAALERVATRAQLPWLQIEAPQALTLNLDGEPVQAQRFRIDCVAGRVRMHLPVGCPLLAGQG
ncbi:lipid kinase YegS [Stenotrophomonas sp. S41]|uniref:lipid kinase YegS n=1 Tax=Stenotrophomonas sp. S41 TaxID=2767464 RepID=UPI00190A811A|nr:lipid kinase YegS [Stenotrophomonas sp. S41]MBK0012612.1 lipid kinase YegS [Stenotrophomonas sp. S41]